MNSAKYANLPDIDTAPDVYETEDVSPLEQGNKGDGSDEERERPRKHGEVGNGEELDSSSLIAMDAASLRFRKAEQRRERLRTTYEDDDEPAKLTLSHRLQALQIELGALEAEMADPTNPQVSKEKDPGELIRGIVDVRDRLEHMRKGKEGRGRLVGVVLEDHGSKEIQDKDTDIDEKDGSEKRPSLGLVEMDERVGQLEKLVGSSTTTLDELSPLPPPLVPLITRLNAQLTLLTQPRHIDSISRRLKLLLSDLDRTAAHSHRRQGSQPNAAATTTAEQLVPLLNRLGSSLPQIPHVLARLRTLSGLHAAASEFDATLKGLEEEQRQIKESLAELEGAVEGVEKSLEENRGVVKGNVEGLEDRMNKLFKRLDEIQA
ncbi:Dynamitin-domain-containing protein [Armillaria nabsnona]|nr:Dynamitin-domain-containing protein [Armillaria nabsnona]